MLSSDKFTNFLEDILAQLGYSRKDNLVTALRRDYEEHVDWICINRNEGFCQRHIYKITDECAKLLLYRCGSRNTSRLQTPAKIADVTLSHVRRYHPKEEELISFIIRVYSRQFACDPQHSIGPYRVDLLLDKRIVVECDEHGHTAYNAVDEAERQSFLERRGFTVYRFNPDKDTFDLATIVADLNALLF